MVHDLIITNSSPYTTMEEYAAPHKMDRTGIAVVAKTEGHFMTSPYGMYGFMMLQETFITSI